MGKALFRNACQRGLFTIFTSTGSNPLVLWDLHLKSGYINRVMDKQTKIMTFEIGGNNVSTAYMVCPKGDNVLGIVMPYLVMVVKNLHKYWSFEITILDDENFRRRFRVSNFQSTTQINQLSTAMPICLADGWNQIQFNLADFTSRAYARHFCEVVKIKINANIAIRRIYFAERLMPDEELPMEYKLYLPVTHKPKRPLRNGNDGPGPDLSTGERASQQVTPASRRESEGKVEDGKQPSPPRGSVTSKLSMRNGTTQESSSKKASSGKLEDQKQSRATIGSKSSIGSKASMTAQALVSSGTTQDTSPKKGSSGIMEEQSKMSSKTLAHVSVSKESVRAETTSKQSIGSAGSKLSHSKHGGSETASKLVDEMEREDDQSIREDEVYELDDDDGQHPGSPLRLEDVPEENEEAVVA